MDGNYPELNTESDTTLEQPDLDQLRQDRMDRNRKFLRSVSGSTAARVLSQDKEESPMIDERDAAAIMIQKHWKGFMAKNVYVGMLYEKYMREEEEQEKKRRMQMEEGELLVENHELEVLLDDKKTTRRNAERRLISKVITIQRSWKKYQERKRDELVNTHNQTGAHGNRNLKGQGQSGDIENGDNNVTKLHSRSNDQESQDGALTNGTDIHSTIKNSAVTFSTAKASEGVDNCAKGSVVEGSGEKALGAESLGCKSISDNVNDTNDCFVNPLCVSASPSASNPVSTSVSVDLKRLPRETDEDYQRRLRKQSLLSQAKQFILLKQENSEALPLNLHMYDRDVKISSNISSTHRERMDTNMIGIGECSDCDINRNSNKENPTYKIPEVSITGANDSGIKNDSLQRTRNGTNPDTKGGNCVPNSDTKGDNCIKSSEKGDKSSEKGDKSSAKGDKSNDENLSAFDVYNIETALPELDWKTIEEKLMAARLEEEERMKARRNDREEIRKKLAMGADDDDFYDDDNDDDDDDISYKKPNLQSRLHSGLQICFMNESPGDTDSEGLSPRQHEIHDNMKMLQKHDDVDSDNNLKSVTDLNRTTAGTSQDQMSTPPRLKNKMAAHGEPEKSGDFHSRQEQLQEEAKLALAQAGTMARMQLEIEKQTQKKSPMAEMVGIPGLGERRRKKLGLRKLQEMNLAQIQVLYNDLQTQIENLNEELVHLLMERDELHMEQDSMLVDIEDLTRRAEELAEKSNAKAASKNSKNHVTGKVGGR